MPDEFTRKRSRSPTENPASPAKSKRANTGNSPSSSNIQPTTASSKSNNGAMNGNGASTNGQAQSSQSPPPTAAATDSTGMTYSASANVNREHLATSESGRSTATEATVPPLASIHMRCLIVTQDASIIIGRNGSHVNEIRDKSGARVVVSESIPGNPERILNVSGPLDAVSKAFGLIVRRINDEPFDEVSVPGSRAVTIKFMIPNSRMGSVIGKAGAKIKEIQEASGARLNASEGMLPGSTERVLSVAGVADAIHIAAYHIGNVLLESAERASNHRSSDSSYRPSNHSSARRPTTTTYSGSSYVPGYTQSHAGNPQSNQFQSNSYNSSQATTTQSLYIPNDCVGGIIGKGGVKINELRQKCQAQVRIMEPGAVAVGSDAPVGRDGERLVVITGPASNVQTAIQMLYARLDDEKAKVAARAYGN